MALGADELKEWFAVPVQPQPFEATEDGRYRFGRGPLAVGVLDPEQKTAASVARVKPVKERRARAADV